MDHKRHIDTFTLTTAETDFMNTWRPSSILEHCQECASRHCEPMGLGRNALLSKGMVWVATAIEARFTRLPHLAESISLETFHRPMRHGLFPRFFVVRENTSGETLGTLSSLWALMDLDTRKMLPGTEEARLMPDNSDIPAPAALPSLPRRLSVSAQLSSYQAVYTDLDNNHHVNNARYLDLCCNALGIACLRTSYVDSFLVRYLHEIRPDDQIETCLQTENNTFFYTGKKEDIPCFEISGTLCPRD
ncbi:MAG: hypothetical protein IJ246_10010 [Clostridia bacterium]|nr:hypothetical protein [Clostridia bacterium]